MAIRICPLRLLLPARTRALLSLELLRSRVFWLPTPALSRCSASAFLHGGHRLRPADLVPQRIFDQPHLLEGARGSVPNYAESHPALVVRMLLPRLPLERGFRSRGSSPESFLQEGDFSPRPSAIVIQLLSYSFACSQGCGS